MTVPFICTPPETCTMDMLRKDPVCGKTVDSLDKNVPFLVYKNFKVRHFFCSDNCKERWSANVDLYTEKVYKNPTRKKYTRNYAILCEMISDADFYMSDGSSAVVPDMESIIRGRGEGLLSDHSSLYTR